MYGAREDLLTASTRRTLKADAELPKELDRRLRINENVMRHIIVCQDEE